MAGASFSDWLIVLRKPREVDQYVVAAESPLSSHFPGTESSLSREPPYVMRAEVQDSGNLIRAEDVLCCLVGVCIL